MLSSPGLRLSSLLLLVLLLTGAQDRRIDDPAPHFTEIPGEREFSGRLIVRPLQPDALEERGWDSAEIARARDVVRSVLAEFAIDEYVPQTDEYLVVVPEGATENEVSRTLIGYGVFQYAEPDWYVWPLSCPDDTKFGNQWQHGASYLQSCAGWSLHQGLPYVAVGICDTGVRLTHEDLQLHRLEGYNAADRQWESQGGDVGMINTHGTITTGIAAANGNNGKGVTGVGWDLSHRMLRVTNNPGGGARVADLQHAARISIESGDRVASISYAGVEFQSNLSTGTYIKSIGGLLVWAGGNDGRYTSFSQRDADDVIVVGATDQSDVRTSFSPHGPFIDLMAPGVSVFATGGNSDTAYGGGTGTSFSTPLVAGLCALIWSANPSLTPDEVEMVLKLSCDDLGSPGIDNEYGYGRINVYTAMLLAGGGGGVAPNADFTGSPLSGAAPLAVDFTDTSTDAPDSWSWTFGDGAGSTARNPSHVYTSDGTYTVSLTVANAYGSDTLTRTDYITVDTGGGVTGQGFQLSKNADFSTEDRSFLTTDTLHMRVWSDQVDQHALVKNLWELKDGADRRNRGSMTNHGDGSYSASFALSGLVSDDTNWTWKAKIEDVAGKLYVPSTSITVQASGSPPTAQFAGDPVSGEAPLVVSFTDLSTEDPTAWSWDFGDGESSTVRHPEHTYTEEGMFTVRLTVTNAHGADTITKTNYITVDESGGGTSNVGFDLSRTPDFSTHDTVFTRSDTLYMHVWSEQLDVSAMANMAWQLRDHAGRLVHGRLYLLPDGTFGGFYDLADLPPGQTSWTWKARLVDAQGRSYSPRKPITVTL